MRKNRFIVLMFAAAMTVAGSLAVALPAHAEDAIVKLVSVTSGKCLQPANGTTAAGAAIVQQTCNGSVAQQWTVHIASNKVKLINRASNLCMNAHGGATNGTPIDQWPCSFISNQNWSFGIGNNLLGSRVAGTASHCIASPGFADGLEMQLRFCDGNASQFWSRPNG